ncbi:MAG: hypothetical protein NT085_02800 [candidate division SR1 bacterium]|nr:hypothetical protein [candidate division SR1 bacterium]
MMKQVICIDIDANKYPHLGDLYQIISEAINQVITKESLSPLSYDAMMKRVIDGTLLFQEMENDMKILQSKFFHYYSSDMKETIIQRTGNKVSVFSEE